MLELYFLAEKRFVLPREDWISHLIYTVALNRLSSMFSTLYIYIFAVDK
jgi:hypothetical protein